MIADSAAVRVLSLNVTLSRVTLALEPLTFIILALLVFSTSALNTSAFSMYKLPFPLTLKKLTTLLLVVRLNVAISTL